MINQLRNWGCNIDEALERFVNDKELYCTCFNMFLADDSFERLKENIKNGDCKASFEACHTLKGVAGNLAAGPLYTVLCELTEHLRAGNLDDAEQHLETILKFRDEAQQILAG
jgi:HPt (histidine-containing phosphotransfer) domain-containing protein